MILEGLLRFSVSQRWLILVLVTAVSLLGIHTLTLLPIDAVPDITNNQVQINTVAPSLSPEEVEHQVTFPVESGLAGIPGLQYTRSLTRNGFSQVTAVFSDHTDKYFARQQVGERLREIGPNLPHGAEPLMGPLSTGLGEVAMWVVRFTSTPSKPPKDGPGWRSTGEYQTPEGRLLSNGRQQAAYLREIQDWVVRPQLRTVAGVAGVEAIGGYQRQIVVEVSPSRMASLSISLDDLKQALEANNLNTGAGFIEQQGEAFIVRATSRLTTPAELGRVVVGLRSGVPVRVRDVALVQDGVELRTGSASSSGKEAVVGTALMMVGENSRLVAQRVRARLDEIRKSLPPDVELVLVLDRTTLVDATIATVARNLLEGAALVIIILFLLLGHFRAALITAMAIPLSMLLTSIGMVQAGISGNLMSLGAIDFGLIVDGAVIIVENSIRELAERQHSLGRLLNQRERLETIQQASRSVRSASTFGIAIIISVYIPILFLVGVEGKMFRPMALTVILALLASFLLSLTFVPAALALFLKGSFEEKEPMVMRLGGRVYTFVLDKALRLRYATVGLAVGMFIIGLIAFAHIGREFIPSLDEKNIAMHAVRLPSCGIDQSTEMQLKIEALLAKLPQVAVVFSKTGTADLASDPMPPNNSDTFIMLRPSAQWPNPALSKEKLVETLEEEVKKLPGQSYEFTQPIQMRFNELISGVRGDVAVKVFGDNMDDLLQCAEQVAGVLRKTPGGEDVRVEQVSGQPVVVARVLTDKASRYGIPANQIHMQLATAVRGLEAGIILEGDRRFPVVIRLSEKLRSNLESLSNLPIFLPRDPSLEKGSNDGFIPLRSVASLTKEVDPNQISRENGKRRVVVTANVRGRDLGSFVETARTEIERNVKLPVGSWLEWGGQYETLKEASARLQVVVPLCLVAIVFLLYSTFGSIRLALLVFVSVPLALPGGVIALALRGMSFSISAAVGLIALSGIAVLNGLVLVSVIDQLREKQQLSVDEAVRRGTRMRFRPVLMTALVASLGFIPMALGHGTGSEVQKPLATVVIGGLATATLLTLVVIPTLYHWMFSARESTVPPSSETEL